MGLAKRVIDDGLGRPLADGLDLEADAFVEVFGTDDARVGVRVVPRARPGQGEVLGPVSTARRCYARACERRADGRAAVFAPREREHDRPSAPASS